MTDCLRVSVEISHFSVTLRYFSGVSSTMVLPLGKLQQFSQKTLSMQISRDLACRPSCKTCHPCIMFDRGFSFLCFSITAHFMLADPIDNLISGCAKTALWVYSSSRGGHYLPICRLCDDSVCHTSFESCFLSSSSGCIDDVGYTLNGIKNEKLWLTFRPVVWDVLNRRRRLLQFSAYMKLTKLSPSLVRAHSFGDKPSV